MENSSLTNPGVVDELRRRKVLRSTTIYAVIGWCLLQWSDFIFENMGWPDWSVTLVLTFVVLGFPVVVALSWAFDITESGVKLTDPSQLPVVTRDAISVVLDIFVVLVLLATFAMLVLEGRGP